MQSGCAIYSDFLHTNLLVCICPAIQFINEEIDNLNRSEEALTSQKVPSVIVEAIITIQKDKFNEYDNRTASLGVESNEDH